MERNVVGTAEVRGVFRLTGAKKAMVAGCRVKSGTLRKGASSATKNNGVACHFISPCALSVMA